MLEPLHIVIDEREQTPWGWDASRAVCTVRSLVTGDYALLEDTEEVPGRKALTVRFAVERKGLGDFLGSISSDWERFQREIQRMESWPAKVVIVEGDFEQVCFRFANGERGGGLLSPDHDRVQLAPAFVARRVAELTMCGVSVLFCGNAALAAGMAYRVFRRRVERVRGMA